MDNTPIANILTSTIGLLSLFTIGFIIAMAIYLYIYVQRHINTEIAEQNAKQDKI
ncbi:DUF3149 domain-containing protein [uncultured Deefgea sp.]|uniref:DUF3149 domain-containing protein n=1 Tax=uncultured Deefgea sp. TaxID=1304914 RepID=UPI0026082F99|nr:DUF3149 domain-containing protein [uncultured Deefgea sp.]